MTERWNSNRWVKNEDGTYSKRYLQLDANGVPVEQHPEEVKITSAAADLAEELGVNVEEIEGSGSEGRITKGDVEAAAEAK